MTRSLSFSVAFLVLLAGCGLGPTGPGPGSNADPSQGTLTPVEVPRAPPIGSGETLLAPGLAADGVTDPFALADAHAASLAEGSFALTRMLTITREGDGTRLRTVTRHVRVGAGGLPYSYTEESSGDPSYPVQSVAPRVDLWFGGGAAYFRVVDGEVTYERDLDVSGTGPLSDLALRDRLVGLLARADVRAVGRVAGEEVAYRVVATEFDGQTVLRVPAFIDGPRNASLDAVITESGRIERYELRYEGSFRTERVVVIRTVRFETGIGPITRPAWVDSAEAATADTSTAAAGRDITRATATARAEMGVHRPRIRHPLLPASPNVG